VRIINSKHLSSKRLIFYAACLLALLIAGASLQWRQAAAQDSSIYWGSRGDDVLRVQQKLSQWGYYNGPQDGVYEGETFRAVQIFQRNNGINPDGAVGRDTTAALGLNAPEAAPAVSRGAATDRGEVTLLAHVIEGEAADEPFTGKVAVGAVIANRTKSSAFPRTISGVIYQDHAFESISNGQAYRPLSQDSIRAAEMALSGYDPTGGSLFFWNPTKPVNPWVWSRDIATQIGNHVFAH
jgi:N-acetylmuramoyl-L-alanine amidase